MKNSEVVSVISNLIAAKAESRTMLADSINALVSNKETMESLNAEPITPKNEEYLKLAKVACQASITAWECSIIAFQGDIDAYEQEISDTLNNNPEASDYVDMDTGAILHRKS